MSKEKDTNLDELLSSLKKQFGSEAIMRMGDKNSIEVEAVSSGSLGLDFALGIGGYPKGRIIEIYGPESSGKTTLALHAIASVQKQGGTVAFIDAEHALDPMYAQELGVDIQSMLISQPDNGEQALDIVDALVKSGKIDLVVVDSVAALVPEAEINGEMGDSHVGTHARLMSQAMRKMSGVISKTKTVVIFINQLREKVGVMFGCFPYDQEVCLASGDKLPIGKIVEEKLDVEVVTLNPRSMKLGTQKILNYYDNGPCTKYLKFTFDDGKTMTCTENHLICTQDGYMHAIEIVESDQVYTILEDGKVGLKYVGEIEEVEILNGRRYDLEVAEDHNYLIDGVVVHNSPEVTTGGRALKFFSSVRIDIRKTETLKENGVSIGNRSTIKVVKNKVSSPFKVANVDIIFGKGISKEAELIELGLEHQIITRAGSWFSYQNEKIGQGKENTRIFLINNKQVASQIESEIRTKIKTTNYQAPVHEEETEE